MGRRYSRGVFGWALVAVIGSACGGSGAAVEGSVIEMDAVLVTPQGAPLDDRDLAVRSEGDLFDEANDLLRSGEYTEALRRYRFIADYFTEGQYARGAIFNAGLCYEGLDDWRSAAWQYEEVIDRWPASDDATDAFFQWAEAQSQQGDWESIPPLMERVLRRARLTLVDRAEAHLRWANAAVEMHDYAHAERHYRQVLSMNRQASQTQGEALPEHHPIIVETNFGLGRTYHELFLAIKLILPESAILQALVDKSQLLEQARLAYLEVVRAAHPHWSVAAGFMIGQIYEDFFLDVLACEVPHDWDELTVEVYFEGLREYLQPVIQRALSFYEDTLSMAERMRADSVWVEETQRGIERVQGYLHDPAVQHEQERLILEQRHPHGAQDPHRRWEAPETPDS